MVSTTPLSARPRDRWQLLLRESIRDVDELAAALDLPAEELKSRSASSDFPLLVPRSFVARMSKGDFDDPLLLQVLPRKEERYPVEGFTNDPLEELRSAEHGLISKYPGRALMIATATCPVHCRYCFRRAFPYNEQNASRGDYGDALAAIADAPGIEEVILSGGDPLSLSNGRLERLVSRIEGIEHVTTLRIHTRYPVVLPERVDDDLLALLGNTSLEVVLVVHVNHANELGGDAPDALADLARTVGFLLNQSVLLRGINDDVDRLASLSKRLFECRVLPYYLHLLDRVRGSAHFDVEAERAGALVDALRCRLPGYLVPRLVRDMPRQLGKTPIY